MQGDSQSVLGSAICTSSHEGTKRCKKPDALRFHARGSRGSGKDKETSGKGKGDGKGKGRGDGKGKGKGDAFQVWMGALPGSSRLGKRNQRDEEEEAAFRNLGGGSGNPRESPYEDRDWQGPAGPGGSELGGARDERSMTGSGMRVDD